MFHFGMHQNGKRTNVGAPMVRRRYSRNRDAHSALAWGRVDVDVGREAPATSQRSTARIICQLLQPLPTLVPTTITHVKTRIQNIAIEVECVCCYCSLFFSEQS